MKRLVAAGAAIGVLAVGAGAASATHSKSDGPPTDFVTGGGISAIGSHVGFTAHSGALGEDPSGHVTLKNPELAPAVQDRRGKVVCLRVSGNRAIVGFEDNDPNGTTFYREIFVEDNGEPGKGQPVDRLAGVGPEDATTPPPPDCRSDFPPANFGLILRHGNLQVHDGEPRN